MNIEQLVNENRDLLDDQLPYRGHERRFGRKLGRQAGDGFLRMAAAFLAGVILATGGYMYFERQNEKSILAALPPDVKETLYYYSSLSGQMITEIQESPLPDRDMKAKVLKDAEAGDKNYEKLLSDLKKYPGDERVIHALIEYYRSRAEFLQYVVAQLENRSTGTTESL